MPKLADANRIEAAIHDTQDEKSFIQRLLIDTLHWPIGDDVQSIAEIGYDWTQTELRAKGLDRKIVDGNIRQIALPNCPWGIFILEFKQPDVFKTARGMTQPLRQVLAGLVPRQRKQPNLPSFQKDHLLFICTYRYQYFRFVYFKNPGAEFKIPTLASFGWWPGDSVKTVCSYNLPNLEFLPDSTTFDDWIARWSKAFDVERVTKDFYTRYKTLHAQFSAAAKNVPDAKDRPWLASVVLNRLMFVYFLQRKGFLDSGNERYLEQKLADAVKRGKNRFYDSFLSLLFFEGFAKPEHKRSEPAKKILGDIRYLNGGLFLEHPIEQRASAAGKPIDWPDAVFKAALGFFASFSWNLNDIPGGQDNEINPDVLGYILEKYVNQKAFGAYYTRPEITNYLCERTIHRLVLDAVNTHEQSAESAKKAGLQVRAFKTLADLLKKLDPPLATRLLDGVLPNLALLDPACGSGAFLVAAMKALIDIYAAAFGWIKFNGSPDLKSRLKKIEQDHVSLDYFIKKRIITDNLHGVDIMEEAVEIARLRLFLALAASANTVDELEPLPNIDFNILRGNSLIGLMQVDHRRVEAKGKGGHLGGLLFHQKSYADILTDRNRQLDTYRHFSARVDDLTALRDEITAINTETQNTLDEVLLTDFETLGIKFEQATWDDENGKEGKPKKRPLVTNDIQGLHPFHWAFAFDKVMARGGFDAIITNPPWEALKPNGKEFFEAYSNIITKNTMLIHDFEAEQEQLLTNKVTRSAWLNYLSTFPHQSEFFRTAPEYQHQSTIANGKRTSSDLNLYKLFVERCFRLLRGGGQCGLVIPSDIYTGLGSKGLRELLLNENQLTHLRSFSNEKFIFENVHHAFKFCLLIFGRGGVTDEFCSSFRMHTTIAIRPEAIGLFLEDPATAILIKRELVAALSPDSLSVVELSSATDLSITNKMLDMPLLGQSVASRWKIKLAAEFHMTNDSGVFLTARTAKSLPMYEGKFVHQFDDRWNIDLRYWIDEATGRRAILGRTADNGQVLSYQCYRLGIRKVARNVNSRTLISTITPKGVFHSETFQSVMVGSQADNPPNDREQLYLAGILNSYLLDWQLRLRVTASINMFYLYQLPVPRLTTGDPGFAEIVERSAKLICTTPEFDELAKEAGLTPPDHRAGVTDSAGRARLRAELDAMVAHLYRLSDDEFAHILSTFPLVDAAVKQAALDEFVRMRDSGEAATFNPDLATPEAGAAAIVDPAQAVRELIHAGESATVEFKSSARWDVKNGKPEKFIERIIVKTIAAFLNTKGGTLVIGVEDNGNIFGLAEDYKLSGKASRDGFELWLMQTLLKEFGKDAAGQLSIAFHELGQPDSATPGGADVCVVSAGPSPKPRFMVENGQEQFFVRTGNATNQLKPSELLDYWKQRWPAAP